MFAEFMRIQATNTTPKSKSEHTADPEIFSGDGGNTEITHEKLESFITSLSLKMTLNTDRYPMETSRIAYVFSHTTGTAQSYISAKIMAGQYIDWHDIVQDLRNAFSDPDPEFLAQRKLIALRQANRSFAEFFTEFNQYTPRTGFNDKALKCHLQCAVSEELAKQLVSINLKDISYQKLVEECQLQDNQLCATSANSCRPRQAPPTQASVPQSGASVLRPGFIKPVFMPQPPSPTMDLSGSKLTPEEREHRRSKGLCFYCGNQGHVSTFCPVKSMPVVATTMTTTKSATVKTTPESENK